MITPTKFLLTAALSLGLAVSAQAQDRTWTGTTDGDLNTSVNWGGTLPGSGSLATFDGQDDERTDYSAGADINTGAAGWGLLFTANNTSASTFTNTGTTNWNWRFRHGNIAGNALDVVDGAGQVTFGSMTSTDNPFTILLGPAGTVTANQFIDWRNESSNAVRVGQNVTISSDITSNHSANLTLRGTGDFILANNFFRNSGTGNLGVNVWNSGTTTLAGNTVFAGNNLGRIRVAGNGTTVFTEGNNINGFASIGLGFTTAGGATGTLRYEGTANTTVTPIVVIGEGGGTGTINASGTGTLSFDNPTFNFVFAGGARTLTLRGSNADNNTISGVIANNTDGAISVTKADDGKWVFTGANTYTGLTSVNGGILEVSNSLTTGELRVAGATATLLLTGDNTGSTSTLEAHRGTLEFTSLDALGGATNRIRLGQAADTATLRYSGSDDITIDRGIRIGNGNLEQHVGSAIIEATGAGQLVFSAATLLEEQGAVTTARTLTLRGTNALNNEIQGTIADHNTAGGGTIGIIKDGTGHWILSGNNSYTGATTINAGTLTLRGSLANTSSISVASAGTFAYDVDGFAFFNRNISGAGDVVVRDGVIVNFNGNNTGHSGTLTVDAGAVASIDGPNALGTGDIINNNSLNFWANGTVANNISGSGVVTVGRFGAGTNNVTFSGNNSFAGEMYIGGVDTGDVNVVIEGSHTGGGSIDVREDSSMTLANGGSLTFVIGDNGVNNAILGDGTVDLDGTFIFDLTGASTIQDDSWLIVDHSTLTNNYGATFSVAGFTPDGAGVWTRDEDGTEYSFSEATGVLSITPAAAGDNFDSWIDGFGLPVGERGPLATPAGDGISNLIKYALNLDPTVSSANLLPEPEIIEVDGDNYLSLTAVVRDDDADLSVGAEGSTDLVTWNLTVLEVAGVDQTGVPAGFVRKTWRLEDSISDESKAFLRLRADLTEQ